MASTILGKTKSDSMDLHAAAAAATTRQSLHALDSTLTSLLQMIEQAPTVADANDLIRQVIDIADNVKHAKLRKSIMCRLRISVEDLARFTQYLFFLNLKYPMYYRMVDKLQVRNAYMSRSTVSVANSFHDMTRLKQYSDRAVGPTINNQIQMPLPQHRHHQVAAMNENTHDVNNLTNTDLRRYLNLVFNLEKNMTPDEATFVVQVQEHFCRREIQMILSGHSAMGLSLPWLAEMGTNEQAFLNNVYSKITLPIIKPKHVPGLNKTDQQNGINNIALTEIWDWISQFVFKMVKIARWSGMVAVGLGFGLTMLKHVYQIIFLLQVHNAGTRFLDFDVTAHDVEDTIRVIMNDDHHHYVVAKFLIYLEMAFHSVKIV
ncbi:hypothetical protein V1514DRAFT_336716 [Lipomyces japonicus]|uniref:uncharacterized protein n=1 Tax=Lipomyces japonicus TaxID=56871 RepID=UPI0034CF4728